MVRLSRRDLRAHPRQLAAVALQRRRQYTSEYNTGSDLNPAKLQDALTLVNARLVLGAQDQHWTLEAWAQNLTEAEYCQVVFDATLQTGTYDANLGAPR